MMDLAKDASLDSTRLAEIEAALAQAAKAQHDILVTAVYWRVSEHVTVGLSSTPVVGESPAPKAGADRPIREAPVTPRDSAPMSLSGNRFEPIQEEEVAAFKRALASAISAPIAPNKQVVTRRRNPSPPEEFQDTQIVNPEERTSPLSITQYGDLN
jgi:hypothetical protein